jgi:predicted nucleotidyltransferase
MSDIIHSPPPSGRFVLRIPPGLHAALREAARRAGLSLNDYCARKLAHPVAGVTGPVVDVVGRAAARFGGALVGIVAFGSWVREEAADGSDVDLLVVVDDEVSIVRDLYRTWDEAPLAWDGRPVEVHFVHVPEPGEPPTSLWAEAAIDGVVLFERDLSLSKRLADVRRRIVAGELARRRVHGQPYWVGVT